MKKVLSFNEFITEKNSAITEEDIQMYEKLSAADKEKIKSSDFVFPDERKWPIHTEKQAKVALTWATWPQHADKKEDVVKAVLKKYPNLKGFAAAKK
jgi:hypothetical protein